MENFIFCAMSDLKIPIIRDTARFEHPFTKHSLVQSQ